MNRSFSVFLCRKNCSENSAREKREGGGEEEENYCICKNRRISCRLIVTEKHDRKTWVDIFISACEIHLSATTFKSVSYLRNTPPRRLAFKHSGGDSRLCTSATVTLYLLVLLSNDNRPGTEQNTSDGCAFPVNIAFSLLSDGFISAKLKMRPLEWS